MPTDIPGLALWLDPSDATSVTIDAGAVSALADKSGNGRHFTQATPANRPVISAAGFGGVNALSFTSANSQYLEGPSFAALTAAESLIVLEMTAGETAATHALWHFGSAVDAEFFTFAGAIFDAFGSTVRKGVGPPVPDHTVLADPSLFNVISTAAEYTASVNGVELFTTAINTVGWDIVSYLGKNNGTTYFDGFVGEVLIYDHELTAQELAMLTAYLQIKWGVP